VQPFGITESLPICFGGGDECSVGSGTVFCYAGRDTRYALPRVSSLPSEQQPRLRNCDKNVVMLTRTRGSRPRPGPRTETLSLRTAKDQGPRPRTTSLQKCVVFVGTKCIGLAISVPVVCCACSVGSGARSHLLYLSCQR